ncbi:MAG: B12-binding domain-containing radical SAM protein [Candidatus Schekmanbacteria bacterium]|nr:B12-binding domain-containing radical SAM protein [Candidatus Schekmanbacteria bacterium]
MKIYLVNPAYPDTFWGFSHINDIHGMRYCIANLALPTVAGITPPGHDLELCDENVEAVDFDTDADIVGITGFNIQSQRAFAIAKELRARGKLVAMGGPYASLVPHHCREHCDVLFVGEAEYTWPKFLRDYEQGCHQDRYEQTEKIDVRHAGLPRWDLMKLDRYSTVGVQTTRGCPFSCEFCDIIVLFGRTVRTKPVEQVITELRFLQPLLEKAGRSDVFFTDDNFIGNKKYAKELLRAIIDFNAGLRSPLRFVTQLTITLGREDELLDLMVRANFTRVYIGIESPRAESLNEVHKVQNTRWDMEAALEKIQSYGLWIWAGMIVGFDNDDVHIFREQLDFIQRNNIITCTPGPLSAPYNTPLWRRLKEEGRLVDESWADHGSTNIVPKNMTREQLYAGYHWIMAEQYSFESYGKRIVGTLKRFRRARPLSRRKPSLKELGVLLRTLRYYLLTTDLRRHKLFWTAIIACLRYAPTHLPETLAHLIMHKHSYLHTMKLTDGFNVANPADVPDVSHTAGAREAAFVPQATDRAETRWANAAP